MGGGGGLNPEDLNATPDKVLAPYIFGGKDSDEPQRGIMTVNSLLSFDCAAYSGRRILAKWQNPRAAVGKPYSGVYIRYSTSGYPGKTGGTQIYKGAGNNTSSAGWSQTYLDFPNLNTTYYLSCIPYVTCSAGELIGEPLNAIAKTSNQLNLTIKGTQTYTIPAGYSRMDAFAVGGGGAGANSDYSEKTTGGGGGSGYTSTIKDIPITSGQILACTIGNGGTSAGSGTINGGNTSIVRNGVTLLTANGGSGIYRNYYGGNGGSGGGRGGTSGGSGNPGGTNGGHGGGTNGGSGQGATTRAFGEASGTLYAGGGGGGAGTSGSGGAGGTGGGGSGGGTNNNGSNATANTGGGGGGGGRFSYGAKEGIGGSGGSGIILLRLK